VRKKLPPCKYRPRARPHLANAGTCGEPSVCVEERMPVCAAHVVPRARDVAFARRAAAKANARRAKGGR
jgi:hypothetical protein